MLITLKSAELYRSSGTVAGFYCPDHGKRSIAVRIESLEYHRILRRDFSRLDKDTTELDVTDECYRRVYDAWVVANRDADEADFADDEAAKRLRMYGGDTPPAQAKADPGLKFDGMKPTFSLIPWDAVAGVQQVLDFGAKKYAARNWEKGISYTRVLNATLRHVTDYMDGKDVDDETGLSVIDHALCELMFLSAFIKRDIKHLDDRPGVAGRFAGKGET